MGGEELIPIFIYQELIGPYGQEVLRKLGEIEKFYQIYRRGADFKTDEASEDYTPAKHRSRQIRTLIGKQAQFLFGKTPEHKISCPGEPSDPQKGKINESDMQEYVQKVLKENLWSGKLIKGAKDCFIGGRVALKADIDETRLGLTFVPADGFVYETNLDNVDKIERIVFFYTLVDNEKDNASASGCKNIGWKKVAATIAKRLPTAMENRSQGSLLWRMRTQVWIGSPLMSLSTTDFPETPMGKATWKLLWMTIAGIAKCAPPIWIPFASP